MNPMIMNMNNINVQNNKGREITVEIKFENNEKGMIVNCFEGDKASILKVKCNIDKGYLTNNFKYINENLSIKENEILNNATIKVRNTIYDMIFDYNSEIYTLHLDQDCPVGLALLIYGFEKKIINDVFNSEIYFLTNANNLSIQDKTTLWIKFQYNEYPRVKVFKKGSIIG